MFTSIVSSNGNLNENEIIKKEKIYQGMNGRSVERFYITPMQSYIFKPLTNKTQIGKEVWIHENVLNEFPPIYPKIVAHSISVNTDNNWIILKDLGAITHIFNNEIALRITKLMARWHSLSTEKLLNASLIGPKPFIEEVVKKVLNHKEYVMEISAKYDIPASMIKKVFSQLKNNSFSKRKVVSHGDLHQGNYGYTEDGEVTVLDWEHAHLNLPYWDLYHLIDISHPDFPKKINKELRNCILECYLNEVKFLNNAEDRAAFKYEYYLFSAAFSIWMMLLIQDDLDRKEAKWSREQLIQQLSETVSNLVQCGEEMEQQELINNRYYSISKRRYWK